MIFLLIVIYLLIFIALISLLLALTHRDSSPVPPTLLMHDIYKGDRFPKSLSEISEKKFHDYCGVAHSAGFRFSTISEANNSISRVALTFDDGFESIYSLVAPILREFGGRATLFITTAHFYGKESFDVYPKRELLNKKQIKELYRDGFEIGSHTVSHRALPLLSDKDIFKELQESKTTLEEIIGAPIKLLSFPFGLWDKRVIKIAKEIGYTKFCSYGGVRRTRKFAEITPVLGVYPFETPNEMLAKINKEITPTVIASKIIPHFAKGSPLAKFDKSYSLLRALTYANPLK